MGKRTRSARVMTDPKTGRQYVGMAWDDSGEPTTPEQNAGLEKGQPVGEEDVDEEEEDDPDAEGERCDVCGEGPFRRLATHKARVHG